MSTSSNDIFSDSNALLPQKQHTSEVKHRITLPKWFKTYIWEGQALQSQYANELEVSPNKSCNQQILTRYRRLIGMIIPALFFHLFWWSYFLKYNTWHLFRDRYPLSIVMIFGSLIAGMTSEGGGSVAFPVMTLAFSITPSVARDFSLLTQSCGMTAASFTIFWMKIHLEWRSLVFCTFGGIFGSIFAYEVIDMRLREAHKKMGFVSLFFAFAFGLFLLNRIHKRKTFKSIQEFNWWKAFILVMTGFVGGIFTGITGSGIDICSFSILTLFFRVTEKTATPTSVVLMAMNTVIGTYWRLVMRNGIESETWAYFSVCIPIVVIGAPLGSVIGSHFHRQALATLIYITSTIAFISGWILIKQDTITVAISIGSIVFGILFYGTITWLGGRLMNRIITKHIERTELTEIVGHAEDDTKKLMSSET